MYRSNASGTSMQSRKRQRYGNTSLAKLDMTSTIPAPDLTRITQEYGAEIQTAPILGTLYLGLNVSEPPLRDNRDLRQALSMAVDRDLVSEHVTLGVTPAYSFVAKGISGYKPPAYQWSEWTREQQLHTRETIREFRLFAQETAPSQAVF